MNINWKLDFQIPESTNKISQKDFIILIGSCFSDEMKTHFENKGFFVNSNQFGTLFHPKTIAQNLIDSIEENKKVNVVQRNDVYFSYHTSGTCFAYSEKALIDQVLFLRNDLLQKLKSTKMIVITFGTAIGYYLNDIVVSNCHKQPISIFQKKQSGVEEMFEIWSRCIELLQSINPSLQFIFTISPVRHIRDGLIENNRSKATLFKLIEKIQELNSSIDYFPSYEIVLDELRDYRFYKNDGFHPNELAISYVFDKFEQSYFNEETIKLGNEISKIKSLENHKLMYLKSEEAIKFLENLETKKQQLMNRCPYVNL